MSPRCAPLRFMARRSALTVVAAVLTLAACSEQPFEPPTDAPAPAMNVVTPSSQVVLDGMGYHGCAFYPAAGNVECWDHPASPWQPGANHNPRPGSAYGQNADYLGEDAIDFAVGQWATCILKATGNTTCWGQNAAAQQYTGGDAVDLAMGNGTACVLTSGGQVKCIGGDITNSTTSFTTMNSGGDAVWLQMAAWSVCWGTSSGAVGCGGWNVTENPWPVAGTATPVGGGYYALCLLTEEGDVDCMNNGYNNVGQTMGYQGGDAVHTDAAFGRGCAATSGGNVECWGHGSSGTFQRWTVFSGVDAVAILVLHEEICYLDSSNQVNCQWTESEATPPSIPDADSDGIPDGSDNCPATPNADQTDLDGDGIGDVCDDSLRFESGSGVMTWDPILPVTAYANWENTVCSASPVFGPDANWVNRHAASELNSHPWSDDVPGFDAQWINAWSDLNSRGPSGHSWTKYETTVAGTGTFELQLLADNCSWIYLDGSLVGVQPAAWNAGNITYGVELSGVHTMTFIIFDGGGLAGGMFELETVVGPPPPQLDTDNDGIPNVTDEDDDNDGLTDAAEDTLGTDPLLRDTDGDGVDDGEDEFPLDPTRSVADTDGDGANDDVDNCPAISNPDQADLDGDGQGDVCDDDIDGDGVPNGDDAFPQSNQEPTVTVGGSDTGVGNQTLADGSTFSDNIGACAAGARNHGQYVACVTKLANAWRKDGLITNRDKAALTTAAAQSSVGKGD